MSTNLKKGQILNLNIKLKSKDSKILSGEHRVVVLHQKPSPYNIVIVAPITTAESLKKRNKIPDTYVKLDENDYLGILEHESYIMLDAIMSVDLLELENYIKSNKVINANLNDEDLFKLDAKIILKFELDKVVNRLVEENVKEVISYIDDYIKIAIEKLHNIIQDKETLNKTVDTFGSFIIDIKKQYKIS